MSHGKISNTLSKHLQSLPDSPPVAWENAKFTPVDGVTFLSESYLPAETSGLGIAATDSLDYTGIYQIDVRAALDDYKKEANDTADAVASHFRRGTILTYNGQKVTIQSVSRAQGRADGAWWFIPVSVTWRASSGNV